MSERIRRVVLLLALGLLVRPVAAEPGRPVAVRWWGDGFVSIETFWNVRVAIDPVLDEDAAEAPRPAADLVVLTARDRDSAQALEAIEGTPNLICAIDPASGAFVATDCVLDRAPNEPAPQVKPAGGDAPSANAVLVQTRKASAGDPRGKGATAAVLVEADGVRIVHAGGARSPDITDEAREKLGRVDVLLVSIGGEGGRLDAAAAARLSARLAPRLVVPILYDASDEAAAAGILQAFVADLPASFDRRESVGNTLAVRSLGPGERVRPVVVVLKARPWTMPDALAALFEAKESASRASQAVFEPLSAGQMNHRPSDGTHTPRWNAEHMSGRELGFFSQIYDSVDRQVPVMDLNPQQMPPDYEPAHPDWTGAEEARHIERVLAFTRRFAYLLDGMDLDEKPPGHQWWTLRRLLEQMQRHYGEHTANVEKKFALPDWPAE